MRAAKTLVGAVLCAALAVTSAGAAQISPRQAQNYLGVLQNLVDYFGAHRESSYGGCRGLVFAKLIDFDGDGMQELLCAYGNDGGLMQEVWAYGENGAARIFSGDVANFGSDVSPECNVYIGSNKAYLVTGVNTHFAGETSFFTKTDDGMEVALRFEDRLEEEDNWICTLNGNNSTPEEIQAAVNSLTGGMQEAHYMLWHGDYLSDIPGYQDHEKELSSTYATLRAAAMPTATASTATVFVDGQQKTFAAYTIGGNTYLKLRDMAAALNSTAKQFSVSWDNSRKEISLKSGQPYTPVGGELGAAAKGSKQAQFSVGTVQLDSALVVLDAFTIEGNNYFKLRDLARALDFGVDWNSATQTIQICTTASYAEAGDTAVIDNG